MATRRNTKKQEQAKPEQSWNSIVGIMRVFGNKVGEGKKAFIKYSTTVSKKLDKDEYLNYYIDIAFAKALADSIPDIEGEAYIDIAESFLTVSAYKDKNGNEQKKLVLMVTDCEFIED